ncbi:MAG: hypothetical protein ACTSQJ_03660 [Promethearchaeota archaeon]
MRITELTRTQRVEVLRNQTFAGVIGRLFQMLVDIYGDIELNSLKKIVKKREGQEVELEFQALNTTITFNLSKTRLTPHLGKSDKAVATVILTLKKEDLIPMFIEFIKTKENFLGILKAIFKFFLTRKIKVKGSMGGAITLWRLLFIGKHSMFKKKKE